MASAADASGSSLRSPACAVGAELTALPISSFSPTLILVSCCCPLECARIWVWPCPVALSCVAGEQSKALLLKGGTNPWLRCANPSELLSWGIQLMYLKLTHSKNKQAAYVRVQK